MDVSVKDFEEIAVYFSKKEWRYLGKQQKKLYQDVMMENYRDLCSLGGSYLKPEVIYKIEQGKEPYVKNPTPRDGESPVSYIVKDDFLAKLPEVSHIEDESDCIFLEIDPDSETELERKSYGSDPAGIEDGGLSDCVFMDPEVSSVLEPHIKTNVKETASCEDDNALDCIYVDSEDEASMEEVTEGGVLDLEEEEEDDYLSDCVYVGSEIRTTTEWQEQRSVKSEDQEIDIDRMIEGHVSPVNYTTIKNQDSPNNNLLNVWYVKTVESSTSSQVLVPGSLGTEQHKDEDSAKEEAEYDEISDLKLLCQICHEIFTNLQKFFEHQKDHEPKTPVCPKCGARFSDSTALERHLSLHIEKKIQVCRQCGQCFPTRLALEMHIKTHKGDKQWPCPNCGKFLHSKSGLLRHRLIHMRDKPIPCPECDRWFTKQANFEMHLRLHAGEKYYPCTYCEKLFSKKAACERHIKAHTMKRPHGCPVCGKRFLYNGCLVKHMRVHTGEKPFICDICGKSFAQRSGLNSHKLIHEDKKPFVCQECNTCFGKKVSFETHLKIHSKNGQYGGSPLKESPVVDVSLENSLPHKRPVIDGSLNDKPLQDIREKHYVTINGGPIGLVPEGSAKGTPHNGRRVLNVPFNGRSVEDVLYKTSLVKDVSLNNWPIEDLSVIEDSFMDMSYYKHSIGGNSFLTNPPSNDYYNEKEMIDHSFINPPNSDGPFIKRPRLDVSICGNPVNSKAEKKQHVCPQCNKSFPYNGCLVKHLRTHTGEKPYACPECGKCFAQTSTLNCHKRTHTGEKPCVCVECGKGFTSQSHVARHRAIHNVNQLFLCNGCGKEFPQKAYLLKHQKRTTCSRIL